MQIVTRWLIAPMPFACNPEWYLPGIYIPTCKHFIKGVEASVLIVPLFSSLLTFIHLINSKSIQKGNLNIRVNTFNKRSVIVGVAQVLL